MDDIQVQRILAELKAVGVGKLALHTPESHELARILHPDEHIGGVVYGTYSEGLAWLIATDKRVIFLDKKPFFTTTDEITYDIVTGARLNHAGMFNSVVLHTRVSEYAIRFVGAKSAKTFVNYIESRRLDSKSGDQASTATTPIADEPIVSLPTSTNDGINFLREHDLAVLSTVDRTGNVHGAVVYYLVDKSNFIYILTKSGTAKGRDVYVHDQVALTVHEPGTMQTVQLQGISRVETDQLVKDNVFRQIVQVRTYRGDTQLPPVTKIHEGAFMVIRIRPTTIAYHDYAKVE